MPTTALKHLAKKAKVSLDRAEHLWSKSKEIVDKEYKYDKKDSRYWALRMGITKRMLGLSESISFSEFLILEVAVKERPKYTPLSVDEAVNLLNARCKDSLWMLELDKPFWRGDWHVSADKKVLQNGFATVDTSATERKSENTSNYYTVLLDNHPDRQDFPKRSRSFIATTDESRAAGYGNFKQFVIIPCDGTKIGVVYAEDMWDTKISLFNDVRDIERFNDVFENMRLKPEISSFLEFDKKLKSGDEDAANVFKDFFGYEAYDEYKNDFMNEIWRAYGPKSTNHKAFTTKNLPRNLPDTEVWIGGDVVLISKDMWEQLKQDYAKNK